MEVNKMQTIYEIEPTLDFNNIPDVENKEVEKYYQNVKCIKPNTRMACGDLCFNYALNKLAGEVSRRMKSCNDGFYILNDYFKQIPITEAKKGDIITYHEISDFKSKYEKPCEANCLHFAVIAETAGTLENTIIKSKWGNNGVFIGQIQAVPDTYGTGVVIWRRNY